MNQPDHVTSVITIIVCKVISRLLSNTDFWYQTDLLGSFALVSLVPKIHLSYYFSNKLTHSKCNY